MVATIVTTALGVFVRSTQNFLRKFSKRKKAIDMSLANQKQLDSTTPSSPMVFHLRDGSTIAFTVMVRVPSGGSIPFDLNRLKNEVENLVQQQVISMSVR